MRSMLFHDLSCTLIYFERLNLNQVPRTHLKNVLEHYFNPTFYLFFSLHVCNVWPMCVNFCDGIKKRPIYMSHQPIPCSVNSIQWEVPMISFSFAMSVRTVRYNHKMSNDVTVHTDQ